MCLWVALFTPLLTASLDVSLRHAGLSSWSTYLFPLTHMLNWLILGTTPKWNLQSRLLKIIPNVPCMNALARNGEKENTQLGLFHLVLLVPYLKATELRWMLLWRLWLSVCEAVLTASPNKQYFGIFSTAPASTGPEWIPTPISWYESKRKSDVSYQLLIVIT